MNHLRDLAHYAGRLTAALLAAPSMWRAEDRDRGEASLLLAAVVLAAALVVLGIVSSQGWAR